jgi:hypothetical protein
MKPHHSLAVAAGAASALALIPSAQASTRETTPARMTALTHPTHLSQRALLTNLSGLPLVKLDRWATWLQRATAAVPDTTVLAGRPRVIAKEQLAAAVLAYAQVGSLQGLTAAQQAKVDIIQSRLTAAAQSLRALLANQPTAPAVVVRPVARLTPRTVSVSALDAARHHCDGSRDGFRPGFGDRDGFGDGRHERDGRLRR